MRNALKKLGVSSLALTLGIVSFGVLSPNANAEETNNTKSVKVQKPALTKDQIIERFEEINLKYPYNVEFSKEDADFVRTYAKSTVFGESEAATLARDSQYFNKSGGGSGISASMNGYVWDDVNTLNHSFGGYFSTRVNEGQAKKIVNSVTITAYGVVGKNGIGKVFSNTISDSANNTNYLYSDISEGYTAVAVVYTSKHAKATVTGQYGTFTIATY
ncbi:hypothetical protein CO726_30055 [Bacillus fungorum]|uniref:Uncharacterized protein n=1 Tax=Bacillus fungorum TaxID=2039284 RepID=A0A2G6Q4Q8_9BACI|nr:hypothetical protein [Bacillus fungorum]PIE91804.1 hypothetical protein CO726_30055 [Bacillus fungorum]